MPHSRWQFDAHRAGWIDRQAVRALVGELDPRRIGARVNAEFVLERAGDIVQAQVDARPQLAIDDLAVSGQPGPPSGGIAAVQVVHCAGGAFGALGRHGRVATDESQRERKLFICRRVREQQHDALRGHEESAAVALRVKTDAAVGLAAVLDEGERQVRERAQRVGARMVEIHDDRHSPSGSPLHRIGAPG